MARFEDVSAPPLTIRGPLIEATEWGRAGNVTTDSGVGMISGLATTRIVYGMFQFVSLNSMVAAASQSWPLDTVASTSVAEAASVRVVSVTETTLYAAWAAESLRVPVPATCKSWPEVKP